MDLLKKKDLLKGFSLPFAFPVQLHQNLNLISVVLVSKLFFQIPISWLQIAVIWFVVTITDYVLNRIFKKKPIFSFSSSINTGVGIILFLKTANIYIYAFAAFISILSKYVFHIKGKHFFNPSNFWLVTVFLLFPNSTWIIGQQWERNYYFLAILAILALIILIRIRFLAITIGFLATFFLGNYMLHGTISPELINATILNVTFLLFCFFMLTDPQIFPVWGINKYLYGSLVALVLLVVTFFIKAHFMPLLSLFIVTLLTFGFYLMNRGEKFVQMLFYGLYSLLFIGFISILFFG